MEYQQITATNKTTHINGNRFRILVTTSIRGFTQSYWSGNEKTVNHPAVALTTEVIEFNDPDDAIVALDAVNKTSVSQSEVSQTATALFNHEYWRATKKERDERLQERFDRIGLGLGKGSSND